MNVVSAFMVALILLLFSAMLTLIRLILGPTIPDRAVALDSMTTTTAGAMVLYGVVTKQPVFIDVALVYAVLSYIATLYIARYLVKKKVGIA
ncbi:MULTISPECIES: cation:proton antiporter [Thermococcus]|uniref:Membrane bound [NiFe]-hydrogenase MBH1, subunit Mbh1B (Na+/H+ antiporter module subunit) n=2 Tax=Thermococcus barophilus TaxID=55802 RepID=A0A0S1XD07_THEBA|nr:MULTISPECIES: cation:proton antiporter [Thermococcus]ADT84458.1 multiple resistance and pH regulation protein [Thermococcus barophilus MP]ALM75643.1 Membrane bound [NiFe]-hydrogenase MBH1, subunit Mbh1B (Na+/H+ antiporter module subunit) [Thermococcus barophilus]WRS53565.1 cation:proton antiporter [Thermococcus sp. SY098]